MVQKIENVWYLNNIVEIYSYLKIYIIACSTIKRVIHYSRICMKKILTAVQKIWFLKIKCTRYKFFKRFFTNFTFYHDMEKMAENYDYNNCIRHRRIESKTNFRFQNAFIIQQNFSLWKHFIFVAIASNKFR